MRGLGKGVKNFKEGINGIEEDINREPQKKTQTDNYTKDNNIAEN